MSDDRADQTFPHHRRFPQALRDLPQPPFPVDLHNYLLVGVTFDRDQVRHLVPDALKLAPHVHGFIGTGHAPAGWGIAPFSNFYLALAVEGIVSPDGTPALFRPLNIYSQPIAGVFQHYYNALIVPGRHEFHQQGDVWQASFVAEDGLSARLAVRRLPGAVPSPVSGTHHYLGQDSAGDVTSFHVSYSGAAHASEVIAFNLDGRPRSQPFPRCDFPWASQIDRLSITIGEPRPSPLLPAASGPSAANLTELVGRIGLAAICFAPGGQVLGINHAASRILEQARQGGRILGRPDGPRGLGAQHIYEAVSRQNRLAAIEVELADGALPVIAQAFAMNDGLVRGGACLVLLREPAGHSGGDTLVVLELLGLTPSEARVALAVGAGASVAEAAGQLGLTSNTIRGTLKAVYAKLGIGRQSELARIVSRVNLGPI